MSYKWPPKDPDEVLDYSVDWSRFLSGATISSVEWYVNDANSVKTLFTNGLTVDGLQRVSATNTLSVATIHLGLGTNNKEYKLFCRVADSTGSIAERTVKIRVKEQ
jgi:hypothetical protein